MIMMAGLTVLLLALFGLWLYALISAIKNERLDSTMKLLWVVVIVFVNALGALIYLFVAPDRPSWDERSWADWFERHRNHRERLRRALSERALRSATQPGYNDIPTV